MANMAINMVKQFLEAKEVKYQPLNDRDDIIRVGWNFDGGAISIYLVFDEDDSHVHLEGTEFLTVPEGKRDNMYKILNEINRDYKFVKFVLDPEDGEVSARDDAVIQLDTCGDECLELVLRMVNIVEDAYPTFMKAIWA